MQGLEGDGPKVPLSVVGEVGNGLERPECVLVNADGSHSVSHRGAGVSEIATDGTQLLVGRHGLLADGLRFHPSGDLWVTAIVSNRVYAVRPDGRAVLVLEDCDPDHVDWVEADLAHGRMGREHFYTAGGTLLANVASIAFDQRFRRAFLGSLCGTTVKAFDIPADLLKETT